MTELTELTNEARGLYNVQTETSSYLIDMDGEQVKAMRVPYAGLGIHPDHSENRVVYVNAIHGDGDWFPVETIKSCIVGEQMFLYQTMSGMRSTTLVRKISKVYRA